MNTLINKTLVAVFMISLLLFGCGDSQDTVSDQYPDDTLETLVWETNGGGDIMFTITRVDDEFEVYVERYDVATVDETFVITDEEQDVYSIVEDIFNKDINIYDFVYTPTGETGTWTTITLTFSNDQVRSIREISSCDNQLGVLYNFVVSMVQAEPR